MEVFNEKHRKEDTDPQFQEKERVKAEKGKVRVVSTQSAKVRANMPEYSEYRKARCVVYEDENTFVTPPSDNARKRDKREWPERRELSEPKAEQPADTESDVNNQVGLLRYVWETPTEDAETRTRGSKKHTDNHLGFFHTAQWMAGPAPRIHSQLRGYTHSSGDTLTAPRIHSQLRGYTHSSEDTLTAQRIHSQMATPRCEKPGKPTLSPALMPPRTSPRTNVSVAKFPTPEGRHPAAADVGSADKKHGKPIRNTRAAQKGETAEPSESADGTPDVTAESDPPDKTGVNGERTPERSTKAYEVIIADSSQFERKAETRLPDDRAPSDAASCTPRHNSGKSLRHATPHKCRKCNASERAFSHRALKDNGETSVSQLTNDCRSSLQTYSKMDLAAERPPVPGHGEPKDEAKETKERAHAEIRRKPKAHHSSHISWKKQTEKYIAQFIKACYPDIHHRTYVVPQTPFNVSKRTSHQHIKGYYIYDGTPQSNTRADEARERVLAVVGEGLPWLYPDKAAFVMAGITFEDYLNKPLRRYPNRPDAEKPTLSLPRPEDMNPHYRRGEIDVMVLVKDHGLVILDIKAVGDTFAEINKGEEEELKLIHMVLEKALALMRKEKEVIVHVIGDISTCTIPVSTVLVLPNLSKDKLTQALDSNPDLRKELEGCFRKRARAENMCLCADDLPAKHQPVNESDLHKFVRWWRENFPSKPNDVTDAAYEDIVGRFLGPLSTVSVWTPELPRAEVRTLGQAVSETARRFAASALTGQHQDVLRSLQPFVYLCGPPGSGENLVLVLKGAERVREGSYVCVLTLRDGPSPVALTIVDQPCKR